jgi:hypothetical protein
MESYRLDQATKKDNIYSELEALAKTVTHFTYTVDSKKPNLIHISDDRLLNKMDYALERNLEHISFKGTLPELVTLIGLQGIPLSREIAFFLGDYRPRDSETQVEVKGDGIKVKEALTDFIPLKDRGRVLWTARTRPGQLGTVIEFFGPAKKP